MSYVSLKEHVFDKYLGNKTQLVRNRSEGHMKTCASVTDHVAWSLDEEEWRKYFLEQIVCSPSWERVGLKYK
jgi:hypothetical protein